MKVTGRKAKIVVSSDGSGIVSQSGGLLLLETIRASGLDRAMSAAMARWRKPRAVHDLGKIVTDLAVTLALGGDCLADVAILRAQPELFGSVASDPTVSRLIDALAAEPMRALKAIRKARATARERAWELAGTPLRARAGSWSRSIWTRRSSSPTQTKSRPPRPGRRRSGSTR